MSRIRIKNFGPIRKGLVGNDGWLDIEKVTVMIGDQGSGKSTVAKLISMFSWLEKNIVRNDLSVEQLTPTIFNNLCVQQELGEYFSDNTEIAYEGDRCFFEYSEKKNFFSGKIINTKKCKNYVLPQIQYVSSARNLLTILYNISLENVKVVDKNGNINIIDMSSNIPFMVKDLNKVYMRALLELAKDGFSLPINDTIVFFQDHNTFIKTRGKRVSMSAASSGIQSITPLLLVSRYLSEEVQKDVLDKVQNIDNNLKNRIESEFAKGEGALSEKLKQLYSFGKGILTKEEDVTLLKEKLKQFIPSSFVNIVEEPEQNLFPTSQQKVINSLLEYNNAIDSNKLIITTHSPYIIGYMTLAVKAKELYKKAKNEEVIEQINKIVPQKSAIGYDDLVIYELDEKQGSIRILGSENGIPDDNDYLDNALGMINEMFSDLLDIEDLCQ